MNTHHNCDTDQNQSAAQIGVLIVFWYAVCVVHNFQDQFLLQLIHYKKHTKPRITMSTDLVILKWDVM